MLENAHLNCDQTLCKSACARVTSLTKPDTGHAEDLQRTTLRDA